MELLSATASLMYGKECLSDASRTREAVKSTAYIAKRISSSAHDVYINLGQSLFKSKDSMATIKAIVRTGTFTSLDSLIQPLRASRTARLASNSRAALQNEWGFSTRDASSAFPRRASSRGTRIGRRALGLVVANQVEPPPQPPSPEFGRGSNIHDLSIDRASVIASSTTGSIGAARCQSSEAERRTDETVNLRANSNHALDLNWPDDLDLYEEVDERTSDVDVDDIEAMTKWDRTGRRALGLNVADQAERPPGTPSPEFGRGSDIHNPSLNLRASSNHELDLNWPDDLDLNVEVDERTSDDDVDDMEAMAKCDRKQFTPLPRAAETGSGYSDVVISADLSVIHSYTSYAIPH